MSVYTPKQRWLHWVVAVLVAGQFVLQGVMRRSMRLLEDAGTLDATGFLVTTWHTLAGITIGVFMLWRWQLQRRRPVSPGGGVLPRFWAVAARLNHVALYALAGIMVGTGTLHYYVGLPLAGEVHAAVKWPFALLMLVHVVAALWHHLVRRDAVLRNMLGTGRLTDTIAGE